MPNWLDQMFEIEKQYAMFNFKRLLHRWKYSVVNDSLH